MQLLALVILLVACAPKTGNEESAQSEPEAPKRGPLVGAWTMTAYHVLNNDDDTVYSVDDRVQYKLFTEASVMWGGEAGEDSTDWFGSGSYTIEGDSLVEIMTSGSAAFRNIVEEYGQRFTMGLDVMVDSYSQINRMNDSTRSVEVYERIGTAGSDALTGMWSMKQVVVTDNFTSDTIWVDNDRVQRKLFIDGNIMWANESPADSVQWFGYGTYTINGDRFTETMLSGSMSFRSSMAADGNNIFEMSYEVSDEMFTQVRRQDSVTVKEIYIK